MSGGGRPKKNQKKTLSIVLVLALFILLAIIALTLIFGGESEFSGFRGLLSSDAPVVTATEFTFDVGRDRVFAHMNGSTVGVGSLGIQVFDGEGNETLREPFQMNEPAISQSGQRAIAFDIDGTALRVFNATEIITNIEANGAIVSASINQNGWFCVITHEGGGSRGTVRVYNNNGNEVYTVILGSGFALSAMLSNDNNSLAILNITSHGSRVAIYRGLDEPKAEPDYAFDFIDGLIIDIFYLQNGNILALSMNSLILIDRDGFGNEVYTFHGTRLGGYTFNENFVALHLYDYGLGYSGRLVTLRTDGTLLEETNINREIVSMCSNNNLLTTLQNDGLSFYTNALEPFILPRDVAVVTGANNILLLDENTALATNDHFAIVIRLREE